MTLTIFIYTLPAVAPQRAWMALGVTSPTAYVNARTATRSLAGGCTG